MGVPEGKGTTRKRNGKRNSKKRVTARTEPICNCKKYIEGIVMGYSSWICNHHALIWTY